MNAGVDFAGSLGGLTGAGSIDSNVVHNALFCPTATPLSSRAGGTRLG